MEKRFVFGIDEGTTSERVVLFDRQTNKIVDMDSKDLVNIFPQNGWVEQDANQVVAAVVSSINHLLKKHKLKQDEILGIAITNQRETVVAWNKTTGKALCRAIVWQCRRTAKWCDSVSVDQKEWIRKKTGLIMDAYFSASKMKWLLENNAKVKECAKENNLCLGTIDSFLVYALTNGKSFVTDTSNASRTMLVDLKSLETKFDFDEDLLKFFGINRKFLPQIVNSAQFVGEYKTDEINIPILSIIGDQQSSLFGQGCFNKGQAKNTYGTGCFFMQNVSDDIVTCLKADRLLTTVAWSINGKTNYALEGSVFHAGSITKWLKNTLKLINDVNEIEPLCKSLKTNEGVYLLPAFTGLGAPYWDGFVRAELSNITLATTQAHIVRACMESMCYLTNDIVEFAESKGFEIDKMVCDGGVSKNGFVMQFQADILNKTIYKSAQTESSVMGAIYMAMLTAKVVRNTKELREFIKPPKEFVPSMKKSERDKNLCGWKEMIRSKIKACKI